ncbi:GNAT family N-acetyltransferase [Thaumasiovibrio subtropicus]|uniref:GNAT family N-acetyltransferase n=1 Tax=Thaumasiovibrio subtropicus TaxID=1891207 RepID=UPI000B35222C|nr:GNAT family N-acetyltransferase [Thaumasiovibrio subtropicus]
MKVRNAVRTDIVDLLRLNYQIGVLHFENAPESFVEPTSEERAFLLSALDNPSRLFVVAEVDDEIVGFITATVTQNEAIPFLVKTPICRIGTLVVDEGIRATGVGTRLVAHCTQWAESQGATQIRLEVMAFNKAAQAFYAKLGFTEQSKMMWKAV